MACFSTEGEISFSFEKNKFSPNFVSSGEISVEVPFHERFQIDAGKISKAITVSVNATFYHKMLSRI